MIPGASFLTLRAERRRPLRLTPADCWLTPPRLLAWQEERRRAGHIRRGYGLGVRDGPRHLRRLRGRPLRLPDLCRRDLPPNLLRRPARLKDRGRRRTDRRWLLLPRQGPNRVRPVALADHSFAREIAHRLDRFSLP